MTDHNGVELAIGDVIEYWVEGRIKRHAIVGNLFEADNGVLIHDGNITTARFSQSVVRLPTEKAMLWKLENL